MSKSTIVLDVDQTLIHSKESEIENPDYVFYVWGNSNPHIFYGRYRNGINEFLNVINKKFDQVIVWSAGDYSYVSEMCWAIFNQVGYVPNAIHSRDFCRLESNNKGQKIYVKPISQIFEKYNADPKRTFLVDDCKTSFNSEKEKNDIHIPIFDMDKNDNVLLELTSWMDRLNGNDYLKYQKPIFV